MPNNLLRRCTKWPLQCLCLLAWLFIFSSSPFAQAAESATTHPLEAKTIEIAQQLRCLVCQNQSIADSNAELAQDLRQQVLEKLQQGQSEAEIIDFFVQRYGEVILYKPPFKASTALLWLGPFGLLALALLLWRAKLRQPPSPAIPHSPSVQARFSGLSAGQGWQVGAISAALFICAALIYSQLGNPAAIAPPPLAPAASQTTLALSEQEVQRRVEQIKLLLVTANEKSEQGDHLAAMQAWQQLQKLAAPDSALARIAAENSKQAQSLAGLRK